MLKHFPAFLLIILLAGCLAVHAAAEGPANRENPLPENYADYVFVTASDQYELFVYEPQISMVLRNRETGALIASTLNEQTKQGKLNKTWTGYAFSGVVTDYLTGASKNYRQLDMREDENPHTLTYTYLPDGFDAELYYPDCGLGLTMQVRLNGDELLVTIPDSSIREDQEGCWFGMISLCPMFGATYMDEHTGYMLIPDGNGALIWLTDKEGRFTTGYSQLIYGSDSGFTESAARNYLWDKYETVRAPHPVIAPVFGMAHTDEGTGYIAVVEQGEKRCSVEAHPNGVMRVGYNRCFAKFILRDVYKQPLNQSGSTKMDMLEKDRTHHDLAVRYCLLSGEDASWVGMAKRYRQYLTEHGIVTPRDTAYRTRIDFLAEEQEKFLVGTRAVVMTSVDDLKRIFADLQAAGVTSVLSEYRGWQSGGLWALPVDSFTADGAVGGTDALTRLIAEAAAQDYLVYPYLDALRMNASMTTFTYDAAKMVNKTTLKDETGRQVYDLFYYLLPDKSAERLGRLRDSMKRNGVGSLALSGITDHLFSWSARNVFYSRNDGAKAYAGALKELAGSLSLALEEPFQYLWPYMSAFLNMPLDGSDYLYVDEEVPFLSTALKGIVPMYSDYINFEANRTETYLSLAETGVYPSFCLTKEDASKLIYTNSSDLYSTQYDAYRSSVISFDRDFRALAEQTAGAVIVNHEKLPGNVRRVTYSNGTVVYVNYSWDSRTVDGMELAPESFAVAATGGEAP